MKLLTPVDGSTASINAVKKSVEIAKKYGFSITLLSVVSPGASREYRRSEQLWRTADGSMIAGKPLLITDEELTDIMRNSSDKLLDSILDEIDFSGIDMEKEILFGEPSIKIIEYAESEHFDLIVMGNRGFSRIKRFFIGSVTQRVISDAPCPVLVIHTDAES